MKVYAYANCDTCRKALKHLAAGKHQVEVVPIREHPPTRAELRAMLKIYDGNIAKLFNTSGRDYKALKLAAKLPKMKEEDAIELLAGNGNLIKRPFVLIGNTGAVGFRIDEWKTKGLR
jgi:arsenate reductase